MSDFTGSLNLSVGRWHNKMIGRILNGLAGLFYAGIICLSGQAGECDKTARDLRVEHNEGFCVFLDEAFQKNSG